MSRSGDLIYECQDGCACRSRQVSTRNIQSGELEKCRQVLTSPDRDEFERTEAIRDAARLGKDKIYRYSKRQTTIVKMMGRRKGTDGIMMDEEEREKKGKGRDGILVALPLRKGASSPGPVFENGERQTSDRDG